MSILKSLVPALLGATFLFSPALAMPGSTSSKTLGSALEPAVVQVQHKDNKKVVVRKKVVVQKKVVYRPGGVYTVAPVGWRRIGARPLYWQTAGCVIVGNIWYCP
jgi:hypothetical protein